MKNLFLGKGWDRLTLIISVLGIPFLAFISRYIDTWGFRLLRAEIGNWKKPEDWLHLVPVWFVICWTLNFIIAWIVRGFQSRR
jgi:hypothetical protein